MSERTRPAPVREADPLPRRAPARRFGAASPKGVRDALGSASSDHPRRTDRAIPTVVTATSRRTRITFVLAGLCVASVVVGAVVGWATRPAPAITVTVLASDVATQVPRLTVGGMTYAVGRPGDVVVLGDFDADQQPSAALLRPATGAVYVFDSWPEPGSAAVPRALDVPRGLASVEVVPDSFGDVLLGRYVDGRTVALDVGAGIRRGDAP